MLRFVDDLAGAIVDLIKTAITGFGYFLAGFMMVSVALFLITMIVSLIVAG